MGLNYEKELTIVLKGIINRLGRKNQNATLNYIQKFYLARRNGQNFHERFSRHYYPMKRFYYGERIDIKC